MPAAIAKIFRYPVKSMGGETLSEAMLTRNGIPGDRCWALKDKDRNSTRVGKRFASVMSLTATLSHEPTEGEPSPEALITLPDGTRRSTSDPKTAAALSAVIGTAVSLWPLAPASDLEHYRRAPPDPDTDLEASLREVFARTEDEPLPDVSRFPRELIEYECPPGTYFDAYPLLIMTRQSLMAIQAAGDAASRFDIRRFRPNILIEAGDDEGFVENAWAGRSARLGAATVEFTMACPRCVMTTHGFADLAKDPSVMRTLVGANDGNLGIYASVSEPGQLQVGDELRFL